MLTAILGIMPTYFAIMIGDRIPATAVMALITIIALMVTICHDEEDFEQGFPQAWWTIHLIGIMTVVFYYSRFFVA